MEKNGENMLTVLQQAAIQRAYEQVKSLSVNISENGKCELDGEAYDFASLRICEIEHWLRLVIEDSGKQIF